MRVEIKELVVTFRKKGNVTQTALDLGLSRSTVHRWLKRARGLTGRLKYRGIRRLSTRPKTTYRLLTPEIERRILVAKQTLHFGPKKIAKYLKLPVSHMAVHRFLVRRGLVVDRPHFRRPLFQNGRCMRPTNTTQLGFLQMDTKHVTPEWSGLPETVYEYAAIDILSRYRQAILLPDISDESARLALEYFLKWFPFPIKYIQTDNGLEFQRVFHTFCLQKDLEHYHVHQDEFYSWLDQEPENIGELNQWLVKFINQYNHIRPHQSLNYQTPAEVVTHHTLQAVA